MLANVEAFRCLEDVLLQCHSVFTEIEAIIPPPGSSTSPKIGLGIENAQWTWNDVAKGKARHLLAMLEALKLILSVMMQAIYTAKVTMWSW